MKWNSESVKPYHTKLGKRGLGTKKKYRLLRAMIEVPKH